MAVNKYTKSLVPCSVNDKLKAFRVEMYVFIALFNNLNSSNNHKTLYYKSKQLEMSKNFELEIFQ